MGATPRFQHLLRLAARQSGSPLHLNRRSTQTSSRYCCPFCLSTTAWTQPAAAYGLVRKLHVEPPRLARPPKSKDRGPKSSEDTQTDFADLNVLRNVPVPSTAIDACTDTGFHLNSGVKIIQSGVLLISGQAFNWRPWTRAEDSPSTMDAGFNYERHGVGDNSRGLLNAKGQLDIQTDAWGILELVWPKPDLLILGTGSAIVPLSPTTRKHINNLGIRIEIQDTHNAAAQFNLLATERGLQQVAAALIPNGWKT